MPKTYSNPWIPNGAKIIEEGEGDSTFLTMMRKHIGSDVQCNVTPFSRTGLASLSIIEFMLEAEPGVRAYWRCSVANISRLLGS